MGLGRLLSRNIDYVATDTETGLSQTFTIQTDRGGLAPLFDQAPYRGALSLPGAWRASIILSDLIGSLPWQTHTSLPDGGSEQGTSQLLEQPCPPDTRMTTFSSLALDLIHHGNAIGLWAARDEFGYPTRLLPVDATTVGVRRARAGEPGGWVDGEVLYEIGRHVFRAVDVLHVKGPAKPGALRGMGVLEAHLNTIGLASEQQTYARDLTKSAVPTGVLKSENPDLTQPEADAMKSRFMDSQRQRQPAVLNATTTYEAIAWDPTEMQLLEGRKFSLHELALIYGLPLSFLGVETGSLTYSNVETEALNLIKFHLRGHLSRFEGALTLAHPRDTVVKANLDALLRADTLTRYQAHEIGIRARFLAPSEARALEDRPPLTDEQLEEFAAGAASPSSGTVPPADEDPGEGVDPADPARPPAQDDDPGATREAVDEAVRAAGTAADGVDLAEWWKRGPGAKKWVTHPHPWTALFHGLRKHMTDERAKRVASQWFHDVFGYWPGARKGKNPVGPG